ncbi:MAG: toprim domain-containing protein, partial [Oscillospiraceae bacterium]|nr:toprim domain-containing protein [Oscillospiraceae bacterium]
ALEYTLDNYSNIKNISLALDNDTTGQEQKNKILKLIKEKYPDKKIYISTPKSKDFNQDLVNFK